MTPDELVDVIDQWFPACPMCADSLRWRSVNTPCLCAVGEWGLGFLDLDLSAPLPANATPKVLFHHAGAP